MRPGRSFAAVMAAGALACAGAKARVAPDAVSAASPADGALAEAERARRELDGAAEADALLRAAAAAPDHLLAAVALRRLGELCDESPARAEAVDAGVARLLAGGRLRGPVAYRARVVRALAADALGDPAGAGRQRGENGAVRAWTLSGPFSAVHALEWDQAIPP